MLNRHDCHSSRHHQTNHFTSVHHRFTNPRTRLTRCTSEHPSKRLDDLGVHSLHLSEQPYQVVQPEKVARVGASVPRGVPLIALMSRVRKVDHAHVHAGGRWRCSGPLVVIVIGVVIFVVRLRRGPRCRPRVVAAAPLALVAAAAAAALVDDEQRGGIEAERVLALDGPAECQHALRDERDKVRAQLVAVVEELLQAVAQAPIVQPSAVVLVSAHKAARLVHLHGEKKLEHLSTPPYDALNANALMKVSSVSSSLVSHSTFSFSPLCNHEPWPIILVGPISRIDVT